MRDWGGTGQPLVLLHGLASGARIWDLMAPRLAERFQVMAVDQRGHGLTDKPTDAYSFAEVTGDILSLLDELDIGRPIVAGHSWGANVSTQFAVNYPDRVLGVIMIDGGIMEIAERMTWEQAERQMRPPELDGTPVPSFVKAVSSFPDFAALWSQEVREMFLSNFEIRDDRVYRRLPIDQHMQIVRALYEQGTSSLLERVECPALVILAAREPRNQLEEKWMEWREIGARRAEEKLKHGRIIWMEDSIHDVPIQRPEQVATAVIEFGAGLP